VVKDATGAAGSLPDLAWS